MRRLQINRIDLNAFKGLINLQSLNLRENSISEIKANTFTELVNLKSKFLLFNITATFLSLVTIFP